MADVSTIQQQLRDFLLESKQYARLQKKLLQIVVAEKAAHLLSRVGMALVCFIIASMVLFFALMALSAWIGSITSPQIGHAVVGAIALLALIMVYLMRRTLILNPIARIVAEILLPPEDQQEEK